MYREYAEPIKEIGAKFTFVDHLKEIPMRGANHTHTGRARTVRYCASQRPCKRRALDRTIRFRASLQEWRAIHLHEWAVRSLDSLINGFCNQFLAAARFSIDRHCGVGGSRVLYHSKNAPERDAVADEARPATEGPEGTSGRTRCSGFSAALYTGVITASCFGMLSSIDIPTPKC